MKNEGNDSNVKDPGKTVDAAEAEKRAQPARDREAAAGRSTDAAEAEKRAETGFEQAQTQDPRQEDPKRSAPDWVKGQYGKVQEGDAATQEDPRKRPDVRVNPPKPEGE